MAEETRKRTKKTTPTVEKSKVANGPTVRDNHDKVFATALLKDTPEASAAYLLDKGVEALTIKQAAFLTGLNEFTVRQRTQRKKKKDGTRADARWSKTYDGFGRVLIPITDIVSYLKVGRGGRGVANERLYKIFLTGEQAQEVRKAYPGSRLRIANPNKAEREGKAAQSVGPSSTS